MEQRELMRHFGEKKKKEKKTDLRLLLLDFFF